jgi:hypothetical protein
MRRLALLLPCACERAMVAAALAYARGGGTIWGLTANSDLGPGYQESDLGFRCCRDP